MSNISLDNAWLLLIAVPLVILLAVPFFITVRKDNRNGHNVASGILHILIAVLVAFAAAGVTAETTLTETNVFVVADVSYSANRNLSQIDGYINDLQDNLPSNSKMGVVCFAKNYMVLTGMGSEFTSVSDSLDYIDDSQTDIVSALQFVSNIFRSNVIKRVVLITDAKQTGENGDSELYSAINELYAQNIYVDAIYLDDNISGDVPEVQVSGVNCSQATYKGQQSTAAVTVQSTQQTTATVTLYDDSDGSVCEQRSGVALGEGTTEISLTLPSGRDSGVYSYTVEVEAADDFNTYNNSCSFTQEVEGEIEILMVTAVADDFTTVAQSYNGMDVNISVYCSGAAIDDNITGACSYSVLSSMPYTVQDISRYDIIYLADVDVSTLANYTMFVDSLEIAVSQLGKSLIGAGDLNLQNSDDEAMLKLANMMPVNYGNSLKDNRLYILVIDISHTMAISGRLIRAKEVAESIINLLDKEDYISIVTFHGNTEIALSTRQVGDGSEAIEVVENLETKQSTVLWGAYDALDSIISNALDNLDAVSSILLITDGILDDTDYDASNTFASAYYTAYGAATTVINVDLNETYAENLQKLAKSYGGGSYYKCDYSISVDDILPELSNELGETIVEDVISLVEVNFANSSDSVLSSLRSSGLLSSGATSLYYIQGYLLSSAKTSATTVLQTDYDGTDVPVYSYWGYGNGNTASFTSSLSGDWVTYWLQNNILSTLLDSVLETNIPDERIDTPYTVTVNKQSDSFSIEVNPVEVKTDASVSIKVADPDGTEQPLTVVYDSAAYISSYSFDTVGTYKITVEYEYKGEVSAYDYYINVAFLTEYDSFTTYSASLLYRAIGSSGTVSEDGAFAIVNDESEISKQTTDYTVPILIAAAALFVVDIVIRKLKWNDIVSLFKKVGKERKS